MLQSHHHLHYLYLKECHLGAYTLYPHHLCHLRVSTPLHWSWTQLTLEPLSTLTINGLILHDEMEF